MQEERLLARLAHRYYTAGCTQEEIAREFGMSRPKVQRLLDRARQAGIVEIRIAQPGLNLDLEDRLRGAFGLSDAIVAPSHPDANLQREAVVQAAAEYLELHLSPHAVVALGMGRNTGAIARYFRPARSSSARTFVSAMGGSPHVEAPTNPNEACRALAERAGGRAESLYAPAFVDDEAMRDQLLHQPAVAHTLEIAAAAQYALVGIGATDDGCTMVRSGCCPPEEIARLRAAGAVGDILGNYFDISGRMISSGLRGRLIGLTLDDLRRVGTVIGIASEREKTNALIGALRTGVLDVLVVAEDNATAVLKAASGSTPARPAGCAPAAVEGGDPDSDVAN